jgi:hypothetical protein
MRILLLAYYHPRYMRPLRQWAAALRENGHTVREMYPDAYYKEDVLRELCCDYDLVVYFGHGVPTGWSGFSHISVQDLATLDNQRPDRVVLSLSCYSLTTSGANIGSALLENAYAGLVGGYQEAIWYEDNKRNLDLIMEGIRATGTVQLSGIPDDTLLLVRPPLAL